MSRESVHTWTHPQDIVRYNVSGKTALEGVAFTCSHATPFNLSSADARGAQNRFPLLRDVL